MTRPDFTAEMNDYGIKLQFNVKKKRFYESELIKKLQY